MWIILVLIYGLLKGAREVCKKKSLEKNTVIEVLFFYTLFSFLLVLPNIANLGNISLKLLSLIALKSFIIFLALASFEPKYDLPALNPPPIAPVKPAKIDLPTLLVKIGEELGQDLSYNACYWFSEDIKKKNNNIRPITLASLENTFCFINGKDNLFTIYNVESKNLWDKIKDLLQN